MMTVPATHVTMENVKTELTNMSVSANQVSQVLSVT